LPGLDVYDQIAVRLQQFDSFRRDGICDENFRFVHGQFFKGRKLLAPESLSSRIARQSDEGDAQRNSKSVVNAVRSAIFLFNGEKFFECGGGSVNNPSISVDISWLK
jgi:hypothetical protein